MQNIDVGSLLYLAAHYRSACQSVVVELLACIFGQV